MLAGLGLIAAFVAVGWSLARQPAVRQREQSWEGLGTLATLRLLPAQVRPAAVAVVLALVSLPLVGLTLGATTADGYLQRDPIPATALGRWSAAAGAVFISALVAATIGAPMVRRHAIAGAISVFALALLVAIPTLPLVPASLGESVGVGSTCLDTCWALTSTKDISAGFWSDLFFVFAPLFEPVPVLTLAVGVGVWTYLVRRIPSP